MLAISYIVLALFFIASVRAGARLEDRVVADIEQGRFEPTPGTLMVVTKLKAAGVVGDHDGRLVVDPAARARRAAEVKARTMRTTILTLAVAGGLALGTTLLLDRQGQ